MDPVEVPLNPYGYQFRSEEIRLSLIMTKRSAEGSPVSRPAHVSGLRPPLPRLRRS